MAGITYFTARQSFLNERQTTDQRQAFANASLIQNSLRSPGINVDQLLEQADTLPGSRSVLRNDGQWYADVHLGGPERNPQPGAEPGAVGYPGLAALLDQRDAPAGDRRAPARGARRLLRGLLPRRAGRHPAHPGLRPGRRRPGDHGGRGRPRPLGQRAGPAPAGRGHRGRGGHRRRSAGHPGGSGRRRRPAGAGLGVQPDDRQTPGPDRAGGPLHVRCQPRAAVAADHPVGDGGRARRAP